MTSSEKQTLCSSRHASDGRMMSANTEAGSHGCHTNGVGRVWDDARSKAVKPPHVSRR